MRKLLLLYICIPAITLGQQKNEYRNLALEGGGIRGIAYAGVFNVLEQKGILQKIEKVAGSSAGAIAGLMISVGYAPKDIDSILMDLAIEQFNDGKGGLIGKYGRVKNKFGIYKGDRFERWVKQLVAHKTGNPDLSFQQLHELHLQNNLFKDLYVTGTNISKQQLEIFSYEHSPAMSIALAVRISGGIPFYFQPIALDDRLMKIEKGDSASFVNYYVDGGMLCNYPISMFDSCSNKQNPLLCFNAKLNPATLGIKLERPEQIDSLHNNSIAIPPYDPHNFSEYVGAFSNLLMETLARKYPDLENEKGRTIYVSYGNITSKVRRMKVEEKRLLYNNGVKAAADFFRGK